MTPATGMATIGFVIGVPCLVLEIICGWWILAIAIRRRTPGEFFLCKLVPFYVIYWLMYVVSEKDSDDIDALRLMYIPTVLLDTIAGLLLALGGGLVIP